MFPSISASISAFLHFDSCDRLIFIGMGMSKGIKAQKARDVTFMDTLIWTQFLILCKQRLEFCYSGIFVYHDVSEGVFSFSRVAEFQFWRVFINSYVLENMNRTCSMKMCSFLQICYI